MLEVREESNLRYYLQSLEMIVSRNLERWLRFKVSFYTQILSSLADAAVFGFVGALVSGMSPTLSAWGGDYLSFALIGLAFDHILLLGVGVVYDSVSGMFYSGRLEHVLSSPLPVTLAVFGDVVAAMVRDSLFFMTYIAAAFVFGAQLVLTPGRVLLALAYALLGLVGVLGLGLISGAMFSLINAKGHSEPFQWFVFSVNKIVAGVTIPVALLPLALQYCSIWFPQTYALDAVRRLLLRNATGNPSLPVHAWLPRLAPLSVDLTAILLLGSFWLAIGLRLFGMGIRKAQYDGNLSRWS